MNEMRPTTGRVLLALFNILGNMHGRTFLDLFSGTGRIAFAADKRGAARVVLVESDRRRFGEILKGAPSHIVCKCMDVRRALPRLARDGEKFDVIFADPPYGLGWEEELPQLLAASRAISAPGGIVAIEHSSGETPAQIEGFTMKETRRYGGTSITFYENTSERLGDEQ